MMGSVGRVKGIPRPGPVTIQETFNLLSALGGGTKTTHKILKEMKDVQAHNEEVLESAKVAIVEANNRETEVAEKEAGLARNLKEAEVLYAGRLKHITDVEEVLQRRGEAVDTQASENSENISTREDELHRKQGEHQESLRAGRLEFVEREQVLKESREALGQLELSIERREQQIESDRTALNDLQDSLDERKLVLDKRDDRVRAALEDD